MMDKNLDQQQGTYPVADDNPSRAMQTRTELANLDSKGHEKSTPTVLHGQSKSELSIQKKDGGPKQSRSVAQTPISINEEASRTNFSNGRTHVAQSLEFTQGMPRESHLNIDSELKPHNRDGNQL